MQAALLVTVHGDFLALYGEDAAFTAAQLFGRARMRAQVAPEQRANHARRFAYRARTMVRCRRARRIEDVRPGTGRAADDPGENHAGGGAVGDSPRSEAGGDQ